MATENEEQLQKRTKARATEVEKELKELKSEEGPKAWRQAELIYEVKDKQLWQILGHESAKQFFEGLFIGRSTWYSRLKYWGDWARIALERESITRKRLDRMPMQNVKHLLRLDDRRRFDQRWIEKALGMKESDFEAAVDAVMANVDKEDDEANQPEARTVLKINCTVSQKELIIDTMQAFAKENDIALDDDAKILELMCAEINSGLSREADKPKSEADKRAAAAAGVLVQ